MKLQVAFEGPLLEQARALLLEYAQSLDFELCFQGFEQELAGLPGDYAPPDGCILLATEDGAPAGCVALRRLDESACEMKRLWVRPAFRGTGLGRQLTLAVIETARQRGYSHMRLDTVPQSMKAAVGIYRSLGFYEIEPYGQSPVCGATWMELDLSASS